MIKKTSVVHKSKGNYVVSSWNLMPLSLEILRITFYNEHGTEDASQNHCWAYCTDKSDNLAMQNYTDHSWSDLCLKYGKVYFLDQRFIEEVSLAHTSSVSKSTSNWHQKDVVSSLFVKAVWNRVLQFMAHYHKSPSLGGIKTLVQ